MSCGATVPGVGSTRMNAAEITEPIRALPRDDREKFVECIAREFAPGPREASPGDAAGGASTVCRAVRHKRSK